jgi:hypothetical protein
MATTTGMKAAKFARVWRGRTRRDRADEYERYWLANGIDLLEAKGRSACKCCARIAAPKPNL